MKTWLFLAFSLFSLLLLAGCSSLTSLLPSVTTLTPAGGTFTSGNSTPYCTLTVPANAVVESTALTISSTSNFPTTGTPIAAFDISAVGVTSFEQGISCSVQITFNPNSVLNFNPTGNFQMFQLMNNGNWSLLNGNLTSTSSTDTYTVNNVTTLGTFALCAD